MKRVSEQIADWLVEQGVEQVFTVTGGGAMFLNQALGGHPKLRCAFMHHEQSCAMAAEGYARVVGKPAVLMPTTGPGSINTLNGVFGAYTDSIPMIVISGQVKRETCLDFSPIDGSRQLGDQEGPTIALATPLTKYARLVRAPEDLEYMLPEAFSAAVSGRPGPVWLDIPLDIQQATTALNIPPPKIVCADSAPTTELQHACLTIAQKLSEAHRPLILAGTGIRLSKTERALLDLAESQGIPVATAWTHDLIASDHPLFAGRPGTIGTRAGNFCLQSADVVVVLGSRLNIRQTSYNFASFARNAWVAHVDIDPAELAKPTYKAHLPIEADLRDFFPTLEKALATKALPDYSSWSSWCKQIGDLFNVAKEHRQQPDGPLNPYLMVRRIFSSLREDDIIVCGNASACILPFQIGELKTGQRLFSNSGSASMGYDLPAALGAAAACGDKKRRVICFAGDGSLQMNIQELQTLRTLAANIVLIVLNNRGYLSIWQTHENFFGRVVGATPESGVEFPDFVAVATAYGIPALSVRGNDDLTHLDEWISRDGPCLIDLHVDPRQEFSPRIKSRVDEQGRFVTPELDDMHPFLEPTELARIRTEALSIRSRPRHAA
jgi:acetolactate synthase-1/2/3 large subunit